MVHKKSAAIEKSTASLQSKIRKLALSYPDTYEDHPWGETAIKIKPTGKVFIFLGSSEEGFSFSVKLPHSRDMAVDLPFAEPTHYGMGKHGWVTARFKTSKAPLDLIKAWVDESFRAVAPKKLVKELDAKK